MTKQWAKDETEMGFAGPPAELGWADHEEIMAQLNARLAFFRQQAEESREEAIKLCQVLSMIDQLIDLGFQPKLCNHFGRRVVALYKGTTIPWGDGGEGDTWEDALKGSLEILRHDGYERTENMP